MIVDIRTYTVQPGSLGAYLKLYASEGWPVQTRHLPDCLGYYVVDIGVQNRVVHLWRYSDIGERARRRAEMEADPAWNAYRAKSAAFMQAQENRIVKPVPFWPIKGEGGTSFNCIDLRIYTLLPGKAATFFKLYENEGMATQVKHLGNCLGFYQSDIGAQNQIIHLWGYADIADRQRRRAAMQADPAWNAYLSKAATLFSHMENAILRPAPFWTASKAS
ncbi:MAG TPA: NIPSNAP family protein [Alphaproteobacteria bacterium]